MLAVVLVLAAAAPLTQAQEARRTPVVDVVRAEGDGVVTLLATHVATGTGPSAAMDAFGRPGAGAIVGSGSVIHAAGYVLTNAHVVAMASELSVVLANGRVLPAHVVGAVPEEDLALLKAEVPRGVVLHAVTLGDSEELMIGEAVIGMGAEGVTSSILAGRGRDLAGLKGLLQTERAVEPRSSGGPLFDASGAQIGVTTSLRGEGSGFAIAADRVKIFLPRVLAVEGRRRLRLGLRLSRESSEQRRGVIVGSVERGTPAGTAGIAPGMVVVEVDGRATSSLIDALVAFFEAPAAKPFTVRAVLPEGTTDSFSVAIEVPRASDGKQLARARLGVDVADLDAAGAARLGLRAGAGVMVKAVDAATPAARAGIVKGDLLTRIGPHGVATLADLAVLDDVSAGTSVPVHVVRITNGKAHQTEAVLVAR